MLSTRLENKMKQRHNLDFSGRDDSKVSGLDFLSSVPSQGLPWPDLVSRAVTGEVGVQGCQEPGV